MTDLMTLLVSLTGPIPPGMEPFAYLMVLVLGFVVIMSILYAVTAIPRYFK